MAKIVTRSQAENSRTKLVQAHDLRDLMGIFLQDVSMGDIP
jgi:hypothetical protein